MPEARANPRNKPINKGDRNCPHVMTGGMLPGESNEIQYATAFPHTIMNMATPKARAETEERSKPLCCIFRFKSLAGMPMVQAVITASARIMPSSAGSTMVVTTTHTDPVKICHLCHRRQPSAHVAAAERCVQEHAGRIDPVSFFAV
jgi:hypothetical protein